MINVFFSWGMCKCFVVAGGMFFVVLWKRLRLF